jgi:hypothetical protein
METYLGENVVSEKEYLSAMVAYDAADDVVVGRLWWGRSKNV